jgi:hypothetical protein
VKSSSILIMVLASGALAAQDAPNLDARIQVFVELFRPSQVVIYDSTASGQIKDQPGRATAIGARFMGELGSARNFYYELGGMLDGSSKFTFQGGGWDLTDVKVTESYWTVGMAYLYKPNPYGSLGVHLEGRGEYIRVQGAVYANGTDIVQLDGAQTYLRPWVRVSADYTFQGIGESMHPFVGVDGGMALTRTTQSAPPDPNNPSLDSRTICALAPEASASVYLGMRF